MYGNAVDLFHEIRAVVQEFATVKLGTCTTPLKFNCSDSSSTVTTGKKLEAVDSAEHASSLSTAVEVARERELSKARQCWRRTKQAVNAVEIMLSRVEIITALNNRRAWGGGERVEEGHALASRFKG